MIEDDSSLLPFDSTVFADYYATTVAFTSDQVAAFIPAIPSANF